MGKSQSKSDKVGKALNSLPTDVITLILSFHHQIKEVDRLLEEWEKILKQCKEASLILYDTNIQPSRELRTFTPSKLNWDGKILVSMVVFVHYPPEEQELKDGITLILNSRMYFQLMDENFVSKTGSAITIGTKNAKDKKFIGLFPMGTKSISV